MSYKNIRIHSNFYYSIYQQLPLPQKKKMAFQRRLTEKKTAMYLLLSCLFSHNYKAVVLLAESFFRVFSRFFSFEEPKWNNLFSFVSNKTLLFFSVEQEKFSNRSSLGIFCCHTNHCVLSKYLIFMHPKFLYVREKIPTYHMKNFRHF